VLYHAHASLAPGGYVGVDVFFVISGFLITGQLVRELRADGRISFLAFYARRARRILPAATLTVVVTAVASALLLDPLAAKRALDDALSAVYFGANIHFAAQGADYFNAGLAPSPFQHFWSLSVEEQFYFVWPLLLVVSSLGWLRVSRRDRRERVHRPVIGAVIVVLAILAAISLMASIRETPASPSWAYFSIVTRAWELAVGAMVALALPRVARLDRRIAIPLSWIGLGCIALAAGLFSGTTSYPGDLALLPVLGSAAVICGGSALASRRFGAEALLGTPPFQRVGAWSYSWYLWHWPLLAFLRVASGGPLPVPVRIIAILLSFALAVLSYHLIEQPFRKSSLAPSPLITRYAGVGIALALVLGVVWKDGGLPSRFPDLHPEQAEISSNCIVNYGINTPDLSAHCYNPVANTSSIALWGDSHSAALAPALRSEVTARGYNFVQFSKSSCLPLAGVAKYVLSHPSVVEECIEFNQIVLKTILADASIRTVILVGRWADPFAEGNIEPLLDVDLARAHRRPPAPAMTAIFVGALSKNIAALGAAGKRVVLVEDVPNFDFDPLCSMLSAQIPIRRTLASWIVRGNFTPGLAQPSFLDAVGRSDDALEKVHNRFQDVELIDLRPMFCDRTGLCTYMHAGRLLYSDGQHLTAAGSFYALRGVSLPGL